MTAQTFNELLAEFRTLTGPRMGQDPNLGFTLCEDLMWAIGQQVVLVRKQRDVDIRKHLRAFKPHEQLQAGLLIVQKRRKTGIPTGADLVKVLKTKYARDEMENGYYSPFRWWWPAERRIALKTQIWNWDSLQRKCWEKEDKKKFRFRRDHLLMMGGR